MKNSSEQSDKSLSLEKNGEICCYDLSPSQKNIDELQRFYNDTSISTLCGAVIFEDKHDKDLTMQALSLIIRRHEALRMRFKTLNGKTVQYISEEYPKSFEYKEFPDIEQMRKYCALQAKNIFKINGGEMYKILIFDLPERSGIMLCASHLIADAWTYSILAKEVYEMYNMLSEGKEITAGETKYTDCIKKYNAYLSSPRCKNDLEYWENKYSGGIEETPVRHCKKTVSQITAARYKTIISHELSKSANEFCKEKSISPAALFESAVLLYLSKINGKKSVTIGVAVLGRSSVSEKQTAGMFISTLPLTEQIEENMTAFELCKNTFDIHKEIYRHRKLPYSSIVRAVREKSGFNGRIYDVLVSFQNAKTNIPARTEWFSNGYSELPLAFHIDDRDGCGNFEITLDYQTEIFPCEKEAEFFTQRIIYIIRQIIKDGDKNLKEISVLPPQEYDMLKNAFNKTSVRYQNDKCVHEAFSEIAKRNPDKTALIFHGRKYTYKELDILSELLGSHLRELRRGRNNIIPIIAKRSPYIIIAMLAVMKSGAAYLLISPTVPEQRIEYMIKNVGAEFALTYGCTCKCVMELNLEKFNYYEVEVLRFGEKPQPDDLCYMIYTSGSTGKPKGTAVTHRNVMNYCAENEYNICGKIIKPGAESIVSVTDIMFDIFVTESILALLNGIVIILADDEEAVSQKALSRLICDTHAKIIQTTPTKMRSFLFDKSELKFLSCLDTIILGGEELPASLCAELKAYTDAKIYNVYGPAETTVWSAATSDLTENDITVGSPIANTRIYILNDKGEIMPVGIMGEICICGDGVSRGYINEPLLTEKKFLPDPFCKTGVMYRTGDMGIMRADGKIEFCGRMDNQIKLRGLRIELGEIESAMNRFDGIENAAAVCRLNPDGEQYLAGFYTSTATIDEKALRAAMLKFLPAYMIPNVFVRISKMPTTQSGKIDRKTLREMKLSVRTERKITAPENETEAELCLIMAKVLGKAQVGTEDDFFELGGDSFSAMEFTALAEDKGYKFSIKSVYECRTVKALCREISAKKKSVSEIKKYSRYPLKRTAADCLFFESFVRLNKSLYNFEVQGLENIDPNEKYIICPNHESDLDCMWVWASLVKADELNEVCALIAREHLDKPLSRYIFKAEGGIPIDRTGDFMPALKRAAYVLKKKKRLLLIHPEGTRSRNGKLGKFKNGAALISKNTGVKIIPVYISGARKIYPVTRTIPKFFDFSQMSRFSLKISFGTPIDPTGKSADKITSEIRSKIIEMSGQRRDI